MTVLRPLLLAGVLTLAAACSEESPGCKQDADCTAGWLCAERRCLKACTVDQDCWPPRVVCRVGICRPSQGLFCAVDADCAPSVSTDGCHDGQCVCAAAAAPCLEGSICLSSGCQALPESPPVFAPVAGGVVGTSETFEVVLVVAPAEPALLGASEHYQLRLGWQR